MTQIKDSGHRKEFETGAVRDSPLGKGRYDLMPWVAIDELAKHCENGAVKYGERNVNKGLPLHCLLDSAVRHLSCYLRGQTDENHLAAAMWNVGWAIQIEKAIPEMQDIPERMARPETEWIEITTFAGALRCESLYVDKNNVARRKLVYSDGTEEIQES